MKCTWRQPAKQLWQPTREFISSYQTKFPNACECLEKDKEVLFTFYDFPAQKHWRRLNGPELLAKVVTGIKFIDGEEQIQEAA